MGKLHLHISSDVVIQHGVLYTTDNTEAAISEPGRRNFSLLSCSLISALARKLEPTRIHQSIRDSWSVNQSIFPSPPRPPICI